MSKLPKPDRGLDDVIRDLRSENADLKRRSPYSGAGTAPDPTGGTTISNMTIPAGGSFVVDGGDVLMLDESGKELLRIGIQEWGDRGLTISRAGGLAAIEVRKLFDPSGQQRLRILGPDGRQIGGESILSGSGFDAPHIPILWNQTSLTAPVTRAQTTSSATFTALFEHRSYRQNPALNLQVLAWCSDGTTAAEVQVYDVLAATYLGGFLGSPAVVTTTIPAGTTTATLFTLTGLSLPGFMSDDLRLEIHARRTAGTGSVSVAVARSIGEGF